MSVSAFDLNVGHKESESYLKDLITATTMNINGTRPFGAGLNQIPGTPIVIALPPQPVSPTVIAFGAPPFGQYSPYSQYPPYNMPQQPGYGNFIDFFK